MKKINVLAILLSFFIFSCNLVPSDTTIVNNSSFNVSFQRSYEDSRVETLYPDTSISIKYFHTGIIILQPEKRVRQDREGNVITLKDLPSWEVYVENKTESQLTLSASGWMDEMEVLAGDFADLPSQKGIIYTNKPQFSVASDTFPYDIKWQFVDDIFYVVIRN
jgi:hypothetical protein